MADKKKLSAKDDNWTEVDNPVAGVRTFRKMTEEEIDKYNKAKNQGQVKVQPSEIKKVDA